MAICLCHVKNDRSFFTNFISVYCEERRYKKNLAHHWTFLLNYCGLFVVIVYFLILGQVFTDPVTNRPPVPIISYTQYVNWSDKKVLIIAHQILTIYFNFKIL